MSVFFWLVEMTRMKLIATEKRLVKRKVREKLVS